MISTKYVRSHDGWNLDEEYLSGYVKDKLDYAILKAEEYPDLFTRNVEALREVQPAPLLPGDIEYSIGSPWIPIEYYRQFMYETFGTGRTYQIEGDRDQIDLEYLEYTNQWRINNKGRDPDSVMVNQTYGTKRINAYNIYEDTLNLQSVTVRDPVQNIDDNGK